MYKNLCFIFVFSLPLLFLIACGTPEDTAVYTTITEATLNAGDSIPVPNGDTILTVSGKIGTSNQGDDIVMDIPTIESLGLVEYTISVDPFADGEVTYVGVLMTDLLDIWQIEENATTLQIVALNDYQIDVPIQMLRDYPIIFALQADGDYMPITEKGPAMLVFPYDHFEFERPGTNQYWIWQIKSIDIQ